MTVWVDGWQMQCCGEPFRIGSPVAWTVGPAEAGWLDEMLTPGAGPAVDAAEDHHDLLAGNGAPARGTVTQITAVHCRYERASGPDQPGLRPIADSGILTGMQSADGKTPDHGDLYFVGYLVKLDSTAS